MAGTRKLLQENKYLSNKKIVANMVISEKL